MFCIDSVLSFLTLKSDIYLFLFLLSLFANIFNG
jgi:hypothetical protein